MIRSVIFDLGGVVLKNGIYTAIPIYEKKHKMPKDSLRNLFDNKYLIPLELGKISEEVLWRGLASDLGQDISDFKEIVFKNFILQKGVWKIAKKCKKSYKIGLLTNNSKEWAEQLEKKYNLSKLFNIIVVSAKVGLRKPDPEIYQLITKKLKVNPSECVFIDDLTENVQGAKKLGIKSFQFKSSSQCRKELKKLGVKI